MSRRLIIIGFCVLVVTMLAGGVWAWFERQPVGATITFPDGRRAQLFGTAAAGAPFTTEKGWQKAARRILPSRWHGWLPGVRSAACGGGTNSLVVFVNVVDPSGAPVGTLPWQSYQAVDEEGFRYPRGGSLCSSSSGAESFVGLVLRAFPRRQASFQLHFLDGQGVTVGFFRVPNPMRGPFPEWTAAPLPITRSNGPVLLTLEGVKENRDPGRNYLVPNWRLVAPHPSAHAGSVELEDATGNQGHILSRREPVWKLKTTVHRERVEDFDPDERLTVTNVVIPAPGQFTAVDLPAERAGVQILVHGVAGVGALVLSNGTQRTTELPRSPGENGWTSSSGSFGTVERWASDKPFFFIEITGMEMQDTVQFRLRSENGDEIKLDPTSYGSRAGRLETRVYQKRFTPPPEVQRVSLDVLINRGRQFEFFIAPGEVR